MGNFKCCTFIFFTGQFAAQTEKRADFIEEDGDVFTFQQNIYIGNTLCFPGDDWMVNNRGFTPWTCCNHWANHSGICWDARYDYKLCCQGYGAPAFTFEDLRNQGIDCKPGKLLSRPIMQHCVIPFLYLLDYSTGELDTFMNMIQKLNSNSMCRAHPVSAGIGDSFPASWGRTVWGRTGLLCTFVHESAFLLFQALISSHANLEKKIDVTPIISRLLLKIQQFLDDFRFDEHYDAYGKAVLMKSDVTSLMKYVFSVPSLLLEDLGGVKDLPELRAWALKKIEELSVAGSGILDDLLDLYAHRIEQSGLFHGCSSACSDEWDVIEKIPNTNFSFHSGPTECPALLSNMQVWAGTDLYPPPAHPPRKWLHHFENEDSALKIDYKTDAEQSNFTDWMPRRFDSILHHLSAKGIVNDDPLFQWLCGYDVNVSGFFAVLNGTAEGSHPRSSVKGKHILVIGSERPWIEVLLLAAGASKVTTVEYRNEEWMRHTSQHVHFIRPDEFATLTYRFDAAIQFSSIEHSGLGRYGDQINPYAHRQTVQAAWCLLKPGALFYTDNLQSWMQTVILASKPVHTFWNGGRAFDHRGLSRLFKNFRFRDEFFNPDGSSLLLVFQRMTDLNSNE